MTYELITYKKWERVEIKQALDGDIDKLKVKSSHEPDLLYVLRQIESTIEYLIRDGKVFYRGL